VPVAIGVTGINSRCISANILIAAPPDAVWDILTDYDNLSEYVPNLVASRVKPHPTGGIRLYQEGAQKVVGFEFRAAVTMDMVESCGDASEPKGLRRINFSLVDSLMFGEFEGEWRLQPYSRKRVGEGYEYTSQLSYRVDITPKGLVPIPALEWRIREDVPQNLLAVKAAVEGGAGRVGFGAHRP
jgi:ribosome-associated toxin RatA of RatAB toxin-antitoxin module